MKTIYKFDPWKETKEILKLFPDLKKDMEEVKRDVRNNTFQEYVSLEDILKMED